MKIHSISAVRCFPCPGCGTGIAIGPGADSVAILAALLPVLVCNACGYPIELAKVFRLRSEPKPESREKKSYG